MNSFILKVRKLSVLAEQLLQSEALVFRSSTIPRKSLFTNSVLLSDSVHKRIVYEEPDIQSYVPPSKTQEDFGKIVELGVDFEEVETGEGSQFSGISKARRKSGKRAKSQKKAPDQVENATENSEIQETSVTENKKLKPPPVDGESLFRSWMLKLKCSKLAEKKRKIMLEGKRIIHDAMSAGCKPEMIFYSRKSDIEKLNVPEDVVLHKISYKSFKLWSNVAAPQGVIGIFKIPAVNQLKNPSYSIPLTIICDNVRDPGNTGTILRVAAGVGCKKVILSTGCVDIWDHKVLRAGAGAHFHFPIQEGRTWSDIESEISENSKVFLADSSLNSVNNTEQESSPFSVKVDGSESVPLHCYSEVDYTNEDIVLVIGGETQGLSHEAYKFAESRKGTRVFIPLDNGIESLNNSVALGILVYEIKRQFNSVRSSEQLTTENALSVNE